MRGPAGVVVQQRMHHPDERYLHAEVTRHTSPAYLMQRLDRGTSGVMFFSKRADLNARLARQFERKWIVLKRYVDGTAGEPFFQKRAPAQLPEWVETVELRFLYLPGRT